MEDVDVDVSSLNPLPGGLALAREKDAFCDSMTLDVSNSLIEMEIIEDGHMDDSSKGMSGFNFKIGLAIGGGVLLIAAVIAVVIFSKRGGSVKIK